MEFQEALNNLRSRLKDARDRNLEGGFEMSEQMLEQVAIEAEKFRKECLRQADALEAQARACKWQADAYSGVSSMVYKIFNGFVTIEEKRQAEMKAAEAERAEKEEAIKKAEDEAATLVDTSGIKKRSKKPAE